MVAAPFTLGERVRLRTAIPAVRAGALGIIGFAYSSVPDAYEVYFDRHILPKLMRARDLERVEQMQEVGSWPG